MSSEAELRAKLFYRGYDHAEAVDSAEQIIANLNAYAKKQDDLARAREQREREELEAANKIKIPRTACAEDPDKWFPELPPGRRGKRHTLIAQRTIEAIKACLECPIMRSCEQMGMEEENLYHGIWGGTLVYERLEKAGRIGASPQGFEGSVEAMQKNLADIVDKELIIQGGDKYARIRLQM